MPWTDDLSPAPDDFDPEDADVVADDEATVWCPYCGEPNEIALDVGSGAHQSYVEDCQVCCQPWQVTVRFTADGAAGVTVRAIDES